MDSTGEYRKGRRRITEPVLTVPPNVTAAPRMNEEIREDVQQVATETVKKLDKGRLVLRKTTGWLVATLVMAVLGGAAYLGSHFFTHEHQINHMQDQLRQARKEFEETRARQRTLERRLVELEQKFENSEE